MSRRTFQFTEGSSSKFWSIEVSGMKTLVHFGKIGTAGQAQEKEFPDNAAATAAAAKLIAEKTKKGYVEQGAGTASAVQPPPVTAQPRVSPKSSVAPSPAPAPQATPPAEPVWKLERRVHIPAKERPLAAWLPHEPQVPAPAQPFNFDETMKRIRAVCCGTMQFWSFRDMVPASGGPEEALFWLIALQSRIERGNQLGDLIEKEARLRLTTMPPAFEDLKALALNCQTTPPALFGLIRSLFSPLQIAELVLLSAPKKNRPYYETGFAGDGVAGFRTCVAPFLSFAEKEELRAALNSRFTGTSLPATQANLRLAELLAVTGGGPGYEKFIRARTAGSWAGSWEMLRYLAGFSSPEDFLTEAKRLGAEVSTPGDALLWLTASGWTELDTVVKTVLQRDSRADAEAMAKILAGVEAPEAAAAMLRILLESKAQSVALKWFRDYPLAAVVGLAPLAAGSGKTGEAAANMLTELVLTSPPGLLEAALPWLDEAGAAFVRDAAAGAGDGDLPEIAAEQLPADLREALPAGKLAPFPAWLSPTVLPVIRIGEGRVAKPDVARIIAALNAKQSPPPCALPLKAAAESASLAGFVWSLFNQWLAAGGPSKDKWALLTLGHLGSDAIALKLSPLVRKWPGESQHQRAVTGLQVLRAIGTDTALMQLNGIAQKVPFKGLKERARELMEEIAKDRGLTKAQLEDRIVPDCGLDARGTRTFDFGPRQFEFLLGSDLKPAIREASGKKRPDLPAPNSQDDPALSSLAVDDWKLLKKTLREILKIQTTRMEQAMVTGRRWTVEEFEMLLLRHPLMTHLARWVVWACYGSDGRPVHTFRVTEDQTLADASDDTFELPQSAGIGIVHPFHLTDAEKNAWGQVFGDYEIIQPFPQLSRPVLTLTKAETSSDTITRAAGRKIPAGSLFGVFEKGGWQRDMPADGGGYCAHSKQFPAAGLTAFAHYDPGLYVGGSMAEMDDQELTEVYFVPGLAEPDWWSNHKDRTPLAKVDPIALSEVLADVETLIGKAK